MRRRTKTHQSEYEGYMGDYGNTMDRWYRRAALVLWPRDRAGLHCSRRGRIPVGVAHPAGDDQRWGPESGASDALSLKPFWNSVDAGLLVAALGVPAGLNDAESARVVLVPFRLEQLKVEQA